MKLKKGDTVHLISWKKSVIETTIASIDRKYITTSYDSRIKFHVDTLREVNGIGVGARLILDIEEYRLNQKYDLLKIKLRNLDWAKVPREKIDEVVKILNIEQEN